MALVHSRITRVFYGFATPGCGLGTELQVHTHPLLNHKFAVFRGLEKETCVKIFNDSHNVHNNGYSDHGHSYANGVGNGDVRFEMDVTRTQIAQQKQKQKELHLRTHMNGNGCEIVETMSLSLSSGKVVSNGDTVLATLE